MIPPFLKLTTTNALTSIHIRVSSQRIAYAKANPKSIEMKKRAEGAATGRGKRGRDEAGEDMGTAAKAQKPASEDE